MGLLITVEGGEFTGKTSIIIPALKTLCEELGIETLTSREPGGTPAGEEIRKKIFAQLKEGATAHDLAILFNKARSIHLEEIIIPFLGEHKQHQRVVLLDRYMDSTRVYQGLEAGVSLAVIKQLEHTYVKNYFPDLTLILYFPQPSFAHTFNVRKVFATSQENNRDVTAWDEAELEKHITRQNHYLSLKQLSRQWNESRAFEHINAAQHPHSVVRDSAFTLLPFLKIIKNNLTQTRLNSALNTLQSHELWKQWNEIHQQQTTFTLQQRVT